MFFESEIADVIARALILPCFGLLWIVALVRIIGLRSFSKMTNFDFVMTVAMGSLLAGLTMVGKWMDFWQIVASMLAFFVAQAALAKMRQSSDTIEAVLQNNPVVLMEDGEFNEDALRSYRVAKSDVIAKLREANVMDPKEVRAVVLETTGDVSVLHGDKLDEWLLTGVTRH